MVTSVKGGTQKLHKKIKIVETYWHDHSLESSRGALSDFTIFSIQPFSGEKCIFWIFLKKLMCQNPINLEGYIFADGAISPFLSKSVTEELSKPAIKTNTYIKRLRQRQYKYPMMPHNS
jgi:hypothetical protein